MNSTDADVEATGAVTRARPPATPGWVKITGALVALIAVAVLVKVLFGGGVSHGPGMHGGLGAAAPAWPSADVVALPGL